MNATNFTFATLFEFATPTLGAYKGCIGSVCFGDFETKVMTQSTILNIGAKSYKTIQGYILVKPLAEQFKAKHPDAKMRQICHWGRSKDSLSKLDSGIV
jgi:hypothetical protein